MGKKNASEGHRGVRMMWDRCQSFVKCWSFSDDGAVADKFSETMSRVVINSRERKKKRDDTTLCQWHRDRPARAYRKCSHAIRKSTFMIRSWDLGAELFPIFSHVIVICDQKVGAYLQ